MGADVGEVRGRPELIESQNGHRMFLVIPQHDGRLKVLPIFLMEHIGWVVQIHLWFATREAAVSYCRESV